MMQNRHPKYRPQNLKRVSKRLIVRILKDSLQIDYWEKCLFFYFWHHSYQVSLIRLITERHSLGGMIRFLEVVIEIVILGLGSFFYYTKIGGLELGRVSIPCTYVLVCKQQVHGIVTPRKGSFYLAYSNRVQPFRFLLQGHHHDCHT